MERSDGFPVNVRFFPSTLESIPLIVAVIITSSALGEVTVIELILSVVLGMDITQAGLDGYNSIAMRPRI